MTNLIDVLKETELRVHLTEAFRTMGTREVLSPEVLQRRLLLCLFGLGTNAGLKRMCSGGGEDTYVRLAVYPAAVHHERASAGGNRARVQRDFPHPESRSLGRGHHGVCLGLEEVRRLGPESDH